MHTDLMETLKKVYNSLQNYEVPFSQIGHPAISSLQKAWVNPLAEKSPYGKEVGTAIRDALANVDTSLLDTYMKQLCIKMATIMKRQRGNAYGFDEANPDADELVTKQVASTEILNSAPTHTKAVENYFGTSGSILERFGAQAFKKATDDMIIRYSTGLINNADEWCSSVMRRKTKEVDTLQRKFDEEQKKLAISKVIPAEVAELQYNTQVIKAVESCRKFGGPIANDEELDRVIAGLQSDETS